jgi:hypothetical protein
VNRADLAVEFLCRLRGFFGIVNVRHQSGVGECKAGRLGIAVGHHYKQPHVAGPLDGGGGFDPSGNDQQCVVHWKYMPPLTFSVWPVT